MTDDEVIKIFDTMIKYMTKENKKIYCFHVGSGIFRSIVNFFNKQCATLPLVTPAINPIHYKGYTVFEQRVLPEYAIQIEVDITRREKVLVSKVIDDVGVLYSIYPSDLLNKDDAISVINKIDKEIRNAKLR